MCGSIGDSATPGPSRAEAFKKSKNPQHGLVSPVNKYIWNHNVVLDAGDNLDQAKAVGRAQTGATCKKVEQQSLFSSASRS